MADYKFRDIEKYQGSEDFSDLITEGFKFNDFNSVDNNLYLIEREAPTPSEKEATESIAYMQGVYDFSMIDDERYFDNREITFKLMAFKIDYPNRKVLENFVKSSLMPFGIKPLYDTHNQQTYWLGKCKSVSVEDNAEKDTLTIDITFDCYPFAIWRWLEGYDVWDDVYFPDWLFIQTKYIVNGTKEINLINIGSHRTSLEIVVDGNISVVKDDVTLNFKTGTYSDTELVLDVGVNRLKLIGTGNIEFKWRKELMI